MSINSIVERHEAKGRADKSYHVNAWESHLNQLCALVVHDGRPDGLTFDRYDEIKAELMKAAAASWEKDAT